MSLIRSRTRSRKAGSGSATSVRRRRTASPGPYTLASIRSHSSTVSSSVWVRSGHAIPRARFSRSTSAGHVQTYAAPLSITRRAQG